jgi:hypothetical protein
METPKNSNRGLWIGLGVGCLALLVCGGIAAALFFGGFLSFLGTAGTAIEEVAPQIESDLATLESGVDELESAFAEPTDIQVEVVAPGTVRVGESFDLLVRINNSAAEAQTLDSIDFGEEYLAGVRILSADPSYSDSFDYEGFTSFTFERSIPAGGELAIQFRAEALQAGDFAGPLDICINSPVNCLRDSVSASINP